MDTGDCQKLKNENTSSTYTGPKMGFEREIRQAREAKCWHISAPYEYFKAQIKIIHYNYAYEDRLVKSLELLNEFGLKKAMAKAYSQYWYTSLNLQKILGRGKLVVGELSSINKREQNHLLDVLLTLRADLGELIAYCQIHNRAFNRTATKMQLYLPVTGPQLTSIDLVSEEMQAYSRRLDELIPLTSKLLEPSSRSSFEGESLLGRNTNFLTKSKERVYASILPQVLKDNRPAAALDMAILRISWDKHGHSKNLAPPQQLYDILLRLAFAICSESCVDLFLYEVAKHNIQLNEMLFEMLARTIALKEKAANFSASTSPYHSEIYSSYVKSMGKIIEHVGKNIIFGLSEVDSLSRTSLHFLATIGSTDLYMEFMKFIERAQVFNAVHEFSKPDHRGQTPLFLAITGEHKDIATNMIMRLKAQAAQNVALQSEVSRTFRSLVRLAIRIDSMDTFNLLMTVEDDLQGPVSEAFAEESTLSIAARVGNGYYVKSLIEASKRHNRSVDPVEPVRRWTPLFAACAEGHEDAVKLLVEAGANQELVDVFGRTALDYAKKREHTGIITFLTHGNNLAPARPA